jgi:hypothetical protein
MDYRIEFELQSRLFILLQRKSPHNLELLFWIESKTQNKARDRNQDGIRDVSLTERLQGSEED